MPWYWIFTTLAWSVTIFVTVRGERDARIAMWTLVAGSLLTAVFFVLGGKDWLRIHWMIFAVDGTAFLILLRIAVHSKRIWPMPVAALQFFPVLTPAVVAYGGSLESYAIGVTQALPIYAQYTILLVATVRHQLRLRTQTPN